MDESALYLGAMTGAMTGAMARGIPSFAKDSSPIIRVCL
jgi:hypothetical protein